MDSIRTFELTGGGEDGKMSGTNFTMSMLSH